jgi:hypothetical protein
MTKQLPPGWKSKEACDAAKVGTGAMLTGVVLASLGGPIGLALLGMGTAVTLTARAVDAMKSEKK